MSDQARTGSRWKSQPLSCVTCDDGRSDSYHSCVVGVVRCADGDVDAFEEGAKWAFDCFPDALEDRQPMAPVWRWWRWNPTRSREFSGILAPAAGPGRGTWRGATVVLPSAYARSPKQPREADHV